MVYFDVEANPEISDSKNAKISIKLSGSVDFKICTPPPVEEDQQVINKIGNWVMVFYDGIEYPGEISD